jgi:hypothetical protein
MIVPTIPETIITPDLHECPATPFVKGPPPAETRLGQAQWHALGYPSNRPSAGQRYATVDQPVGDPGWAACRG